MKADYEGWDWANVVYSEKLMKLDVKKREYDIIVIGEEPHLAYNRVGLTSFFQHRVVENLYLNPKEWVRVPLLLTHYTHS